MKTKRLSIKYHRVSLREVLNFFGDAYKTETGKIVRFEAYVDTARATVIFELYVEEEYEE